MENELKDLLAIEEQAERLVAKAEAEHKSRVDAAREEARSMEREFEHESNDILAHRIEKAEMRARQTIAELQRHYEERDAELRSAAKAHHAKAVAAALQRFQASSEDR